MTEETIVESVKHIREQLHIAKELVAEMYEYTFVYPGCPTVEWDNQENDNGLKDSRASSSTKT